MGLVIAGIGSNPLTTPIGIKPVEDGWFGHKDIQNRQTALSYILLSEIFGSNNNIIMCVSYI